MSGGLDLLYEMDVTLPDHIPRTSTPTDEGNTSRELFGPVDCSPVDIGDDDDPLTAVTTPVKKSPIASRVSIQNSLVSTKTKSAARFSTQAEDVMVLKGSGKIKKSKSDPSESTVSVTTKTEPTTSKGKSKRSSNAVRGRNFTAEETETILREAGKYSKILKGRFNSVNTKELKQKHWIRITSLVNKVNAVGDRDWRNVRKKWQDLTSSARAKYRDQLREQRKTGGGVSQAPTLTKFEQIAIDSVSNVSVHGLQYGMDSNETDVAIPLSEPPESGPSATSSLSKSGRMVSLVANLLNESDDSEVSFDLPTRETDHSPDRKTSIMRYTSNERTYFDDPELTSASEPESPSQSSRRRQPAPRLGGPGPSGVTYEHETDKPRKDFQQPPSSSRTRTSTNAEPKLPSLKSNRTVTKDMRRSEFKQILERYDKIQEILAEILRLKKLKYLSLGINIDKPKAKDS